jgi:hypothetical protein
MLLFSTTTLRSAVHLLTFSPNSHLLLSYKQVTLSPRTPCFGTMPSHGLLGCVIELGNSNLRLREYGTKYHDRTVETYVAIPGQPTPFSIHLNSHGYIAPGLSLFVYIDGIYQTNRNKRGLTPPTPDAPNSADVEFRLGNKEDILKDGLVISRGWWFDKLNIGTLAHSQPVRPHFAH